MKTILFILLLLSFGAGAQTVLNSKIPLTKENIYSDNNTEQKNLNAFVDGVLSVSYHGGSNLIYLPELCRYRL